VLFVTLASIEVRTYVSYFEDFAHFSREGGVAVIPNWVIESKRARFEAAPGENEMYPEIMVIPMREELTRAGIAEARTAADVDKALAQPGTTMVVVNSICGCAAGKMRPGVRLAMQHAAKPDHSVTVFAGQDREATEKARSYFGGHPPTSPAIAILRDGQLVYLMQRSAIETSTAPAIAQELARAFDTYCAPTTA
jgi:putative YphP/YqiW family bacilliredoxin